MATIGDTLTAPEAGWKRIDDTDSSFTYVGASWTSYPFNGFYEGTAHTSYPVSADLGVQVKFQFKGTKIRIIAQSNNEAPQSVEIKIDDNTETYSQYAENTGSTGLQRLCYEKLGLANGVHTVVITKTTAGFIQLDAIDIDVAGEIKPYAPIDAPTNLVATAGDSKVGLTWTAVSTATIYNVKRSTTAGGTYTTIANNVTDASYVDTSVTNGTTYYYVVTVVNSAGESNTSNEALATPVASSDSLLQITMNDSSEREYKVTQIEVDNFIKWINSTGRTGDNCYKFDDVIDSSTEYLIFEKIISFKVIPVGK